MKIGILKEAEDTRVSIIPDIASKLISEKNGLQVESGAGEKAFYSDKDYVEAGANIVSRNEILETSDLIISIHPPKVEDMQKMRKGTNLVSSFQPFFTKTYVEEAAPFGLNLYSLDMIPRITIAQAMDVLSSMASIAGYKAVLNAANLMPRYFPMLTTAAGSIPPAKVLVIGAGVAGLQAIATAKRLGAVIEAFDTRAAAKEEVQSLGAKFVEVEGAKDDKSAGGYAVEQTEEYIQKQKALIHEKVSKSDVVICTAQVRGRKAPLLVTKAMVEDMKPGSIVVDLAASTGGNCELTQDKKTIMHKQVIIIGNSELPSEMPMHASQLYAKNIHNFLKVLLKDGEINPDRENQILKSCCVVHDGIVV
jgi:H+-translocating NAD(P) transhydrogenase subunit alpha